MALTDAQVDMHRSLLPGCSSIQLSWVSPRHTFFLHTFLFLFTSSSNLEEKKKERRKKLSFWIFGMKGDRYRSTTLIIALRIATLTRDHAERQEYFWEYVKPSKNVSNQFSILTSNFQCQKFIPLKLYFISDSSSKCAAACWRPKPYRRPCPLG